MCFKGKLFCCIPVERACLVLGILFAIANLLLFMWYGLVWFLALVLGDPGISFKFGGKYHRDWIPEVFVYAVVPLVVVFNFIFAVFLCNGICAGRPRQVKAYYIYGIIVTVLATLVAVMLLSCDSQQLGLRPYLDPGADMAFNIVQGLWWLFGCAMHTLFLVLVRQTHKRLRDDVKSSSYVHLQEFGVSKERYKMCYQGKFLYCLPVEWVCLAIGIISAIGDLLLLMGYAFMWFLAIAMGEPGNLFGGYYDRDWIPEVFLIIIVPITIILDFIFSVLLCNGICQRQPKQVKAYLVYGIVITALATLMSVLLLSCDAEQLGLQRYTNPQNEIEFRTVQGLWVLFGCVLHSLFLVLVHQTHKKLQSDTPTFDDVGLLKSGYTKQGLYV